MSFYVTRTINNAETRVTWQGKVAGDELKLKRAAAGSAANPAEEIIMKRAKASRADRRRQAGR